MTTRSILYAQLREQYQRSQPELTEQQLDLMALMTATGSARKTLLLNFIVDRAAFVLDGHLVFNSAAELGQRGLHLRWEFSTDGMEVLVWGGKSIAQSFPLNAEVAFRGDIAKSFSEEALPHPSRYRPERYSASPRPREAQFKNWYKAYGSHLSMFFVNDRLVHRSYDSSTVPNSLKRFDGGDDGGEGGYMIEFLNDALDGTEEDPKKNVLVHDSQLVDIDGPASIIIK